MSISPSHFYLISPRLYQIELIFEFYCNYHHDIHIANHHAAHICYCFFLSQHIVFHYSLLFVVAIVFLRKIRKCDIPRLPQACGLLFRIIPVLNSNCMTFSGSSVYRINSRIVLKRIGAMPAGERLFFTRSF